ncbi:Cys-tRNA(Pro)/Cys-tRNA(Cys) deacylase [Reticulibacter mediterranei]|uniref:Cys-tRNA(Pro)/Cys-tRNA(Cys) deacylase n=1 Tax=Reticulibacter mediterranei TaxID=2778369 RepID=A0A8J3IPH4_9CHLR|nr:YbaK/EbsC family protein [Reticulibacter mediterranei]GHO96178.1 Cys-tRNA(Pro)/Cys-tRNA(Cys) deacylase [Reticulibacter mediterranei]
MAKTPRTQAMRALDARKIPYQIDIFPDTIHDAVQVAAAIGKPVDQVFKTLVLLREDVINARPLLVMVPANREIDVRLLARELGVKSVRMAGHDQAEKLTGLKVGGISALALLNRPFDVYLDDAALQYEQILVSGGQRGVDLELRVSDLLAVTGAQTIVATRSKE